jgi:DNA repair protein RecO (recombination protein O)
LILDDQPFPEALQLLLNTLYVLGAKDWNPDFIARVFETRMLSVAGFAPILDRCSVCGASVGSAREPWYAFGSHGYGLLCGAEKCWEAAGRHVGPLSAGAVRALRYVTECESGAIFSFTVNDRILAEISAVIPVYLQYHLGKGYQKLEEVKRYRLFEEEMTYRVQSGRAAAPNSGSPGVGAEPESRAEAAAAAPEGGAR